MIHVAENIWIGDSVVSWRELRSAGIGAVLNVAQDLRGTLGWPNVEYMQVGLVDGPGNPPSAYCAAVLALAALSSRRRTLVCCHTGSRSLAVVLMYLNVSAGRGWDGLVDLLRERVDEDLPVPHEAHIEAFDEMDWKSLANILRG